MSCCRFCKSCQSQVSIPTDPNPVPP